MTFSLFTVGHKKNFFYYSEFLDGKKKKKKLKTKLKLSKKKKKNKKVDLNASFEEY